MWPQIEGVEGVGEVGEVGRAAGSLEKHRPGARSKAEV